MRFRKLLALAALLFLAGSARAGRASFSSALGTVDDLEKRVQPDMVQLNASSLGIGNVPYLPALGAPPKRVALVSFYVSDLGAQGPTSALYQGELKTAAASSVDGSSVVASALLAQGLSALRAALAEFGMQLLTPEQFLDSADKRELYYKFAMRPATLAPAAEKPDPSKVSPEAKTQPPSRVAGGYRLLALPDVQGVRLVAQGSGPINESLGDALARGLGVDAVLVIYNNCDILGNAARLQAVSFYLFGPNPVKGARNPSYWTGHLYVGLRLDVLAAPFVTFGKKGIKSGDYKGYEKVMAALAKRAGVYLRSATAPKP